MAVDYERLVETIQSCRECEWIEVKHNDAEGEEIGQYISAIANSVVLNGREVGYLAWGFEDVTLTLVGTSFKPRRTKIGNEELENWLHHQLRPSINFSIHEFNIDGLPVVVIEVPPAQHMPVRWKGNAYIRIGSYKKRLNDHPDKERTLWNKLAYITFEVAHAATYLPGAEILSRLSYTEYFEMSGAPLPSDQVGILHDLHSAGFITSSDDGSHSVTNLGAILFAKKLSSFPHLGRKAVRVIVYKDKNRIGTIREFTPDRGYAAVFAGLIEFIHGQLPTSEQIGQALRESVPLYPEVAIRELVANALIHQDFSLSGVSPMVEIFADRIEITNPGKPLIDKLRFLDGPPQSRNEKLAGVMRRLKICEERGTGIDRAIFEIELFQLPPLDISNTESHTKVTLYAPRPHSKMTKQEMVLACYQHACLQRVSGEVLTNASLRKRLSISDENYPAASRVIKDTLAIGLIKPQDPDSASRKHARYLPFWA